MVTVKYFPVLDVLRLFASLGVVVTHSAIFYNRAHPGNLSFSGGIFNAGYFGVIFFYVLSGFLITYLLLSEKKNTGSIRIGKFYMRRMLRIWPLYYLIVILSFLVFPHLQPLHDAFNISFDINHFVLYLLFLPNIAALSRQFFNINCFHTYTIGYEEQFYLLWPLIIKSARKFLLPLLIFLFFLPPLLELVRLWLISEQAPHGSVSRTLAGILTLVYYSNFQAFIAGGIAGYIFVSGKKMNRIANPACLSAMVLALVLLMFIGPSGYPGYANLVSIVFAIFIYNMVYLKFNENILFKRLSQLGKASYGIYIFHPAVFMFTAYLYSRGLIIKVQNPYLEFLEYFFISLVLIIGVSLISYKYFESIFLRKKLKFEPGTENTVRFFKWFYGKNRYQHSNG